MKVLDIEDKSFLHKNHIGNDQNKYHLKLIIKSNELKKMKKIESTRKIYSILEDGNEKRYSFYSDTNYLIDL